MRTVYGVKPSCETCDCLSPSKIMCILKAEECLQSNNFETYPTEVYKLELCDRYRVREEFIPEFVICNNSTEFLNLMWSYCNDGFVCSDGFGKKYPRNPIDELYEFATEYEWLDVTAIIDEYFESESEDDSETLFNSISDMIKQSIDNRYKFPTITHIHDSRNFDRCGDMQTRIFHTVELKDVVGYNELA